MDKQKNRHAGPLTYLTAAIVFISFVSFLILMYVINSGIEFSWEKPVQSYFQNWNEGNVHMFFKYWTELGSRGGIGVVTLALMIWLLWKKKDLIAVAIVAFLVAGTDRLNVFVKGLVGRDRPLIDPSIDAVGYSFPSGHAMLSIVTYAVVAYFISKYLQGKRKKVLIWITAIIIIIVTGISRIVLSAHFPSDVLAGYFLGLVCIILAIKLYHLLRKVIYNSKTK
ncbi:MULTISPECIES: phosphatase PAP2 family protein [Bacillus]|uniref:phosphatase PAP2 family protein n=1 Tax=Bacillus TaxID=1386 RepID=UPI0002F266E3|nr:MULTISPECIES: phosphatase PAP2 family protein [Bacillus]